MTARIIKAIQPSARDHAGPCHRPAAAAPRRLQGRSGSGAARRRRDRHHDRDQRPSRIASTSTGSTASAPGPWASSWSSIPTRTAPATWRCTASASTWPAAAGSPGTTCTIRNQQRRSAPTCAAASSRERKSTAPARSRLRRKPCRFDRKRAMKSKTPRRSNHSESSTTARTAKPRLQPAVIRQADAALLARGHNPVRDHLPARGQSLPGTKSWVGACRSRRATESGVLSACSSRCWHAAAS